MAAPLPTGSSLSALPVAPSINPMQAVANTDPVGNMAIGMDFAQKFARINQLKDQLALEDLQRKADMAKAKTMAAEADLLRGNLATQFAASKAQLEALAATQKNVAAQQGALAGTVVPTAQAAGQTGLLTAQAGQETAAANLAATAGPGGLADLGGQTALNNAAFGRDMSSMRRGLLSTTPGATPAQAQAVASGYSSTPAAGSTPLPAGLTPTNPGEYEQQYAQAFQRLLVNSPDRLPQTDDVLKAMGAAAKQESFPDATGAKHTVDVVYNQKTGQVWAAGPAHLAEQSPAQAKEQTEAASALKGFQFLDQQTNMAISALDEYAKSGVPGTGQGMLNAAANMETGSGVMSVAKTALKIQAQKQVNPQTIGLAAQLNSLNAEAVKQAFGGRLNAQTIDTLVSSLPTPTDMQTPANAKAKLETFKKLLNVAQNVYASTSASSAIANARTSGAVAARTPQGEEIRFGPNGEQYVLRNGAVVQIK